MEQIPITAMIVNKAPVLFGLTSSMQPHQFLLIFDQIEHIPAQIRESHPTAINGTKILPRLARWYVKYRSTIGAVMMAVAMPLKSKQAPMNPLMSAEYPTGC